LLHDVVFCLREPERAMDQAVFSEEITDHYGRKTWLDICVGDILDCRGKEVDILVLSAFPDDYAKTEGSVIGKLLEIGVDVEQLARRKERDMRESWSCWVSREIEGASQPVRRILCFENGFDRHRGKHPGTGAPKAVQNPADLVGNVFRSAREFLLTEPQRKASIVRVPLLATGDQKHDRLDMLRAIVRQAFLHLQFCDSIERIQIFLRPSTEWLHRLLVEAGSVIHECRTEFPMVEQAGRYDYFISYRHVDSAIKDRLVQAIRNKHPGVNLFVDKEKLEPGSFWKAELLRAMSQSRQAVCLVTDSYPEAPECMDEFHMAFNFNSRHKGFLRPILSFRNRDISSLKGSMNRIHWDNRGFPPDFSGWT
jgi:hypothetical protein